MTGYADLEKRLREATSRIAHEAADAIAALRRERAEEFRAKRALWDALIPPGPRCRDCADFDGRCQGTGRPCDPQEHALEIVSRLREERGRMQATQGFLTPNLAGEYVECLVGDKATVVEDVQGLPAAALLLDMTTRKVIGVRVYSRSAARRAYEGREKP